MQGVKIWLDDKRPAPEGWERCYWPIEVISKLAFYRDMGISVEVISLDHDLGNDDRGTGYEVLCWIEEKVVMEDYNPPEIRIHSDNASAVQKMHLAVASIKKHSEKT